MKKETAVRLGLCALVSVGTIALVGAISGANVAEVCVGAVVCWVLLTWATRP